MVRAQKLALKAERKVVLDKSLAAADGRVISDKDGGRECYSEWSK